MERSFAVLPARAIKLAGPAGLPQDVFEEINGIQNRQRLNSVMDTGSPGIIPLGK